MEQLLEDPAWPVRIGGPFAAIRASRVLLTSIPSIPKVVSEREKYDSIVYFGCRDAKLRGMNSIMYKVVKQSRMAESPVVAKLCVCVLDHTKGRRTLLSHLIRNRTTCSRMTRARSTGGL